MDEVGHVAQVADVEQAVVRRAVVAAEAAAIHAERDGQILHRHVVNDHVVGALHERGINRQERLQPLGGEAAGEERGVLLGDADIEVAVGMFRLEKTEARAAGHRAGDGDDFSVPLGEFANVSPRIAE